MSPAIIDAIIVAVIIAVNTICSLIYMLTALFRESREEALENDRLPTRQRCIMQGYVSLICPVVAPLYFILSSLVYRFISDKPVKYDEISFNKERVKTIVAPDFEKELNIVPVEEALAVSDKYSLRRLMMDVLKNNRDDSLSAISLSLSSEDSETSHYAASVLMDVLSEFRKKAASLQLKLEQEKDEDGKIAVELLTYILFFLGQNVFSFFETETYTGIALSAADGLYEKDGKLISPVLMASLIESLLIIERTDDAARWTEHIRQTYPDTVQRYMSAIKLCYYNNDSDGFFMNIRQLRESGVPISHEVLQIIKMFDTKQARARSSAEADEN